ncbi:MAG: DUF3850 domain-containing protein [Dehalococcoidia bacterium]|nr:DUF3850 domain-containing protein [Dehalococcoidia bacterium]
MTDRPNAKCDQCIAEGKNSEKHPPPGMVEQSCYMCGHMCDEPNCCKGIKGWQKHYPHLGRPVPPHLGRPVPVDEVKPLMGKIAYLDCLVRKLQGQVRGRGQTICLLQGKLSQWNEAVIEGAKLAGYSLKFDDPDHDFATGWPPGVYPGHIEKLIQHVVDRKNQIRDGLLAEQAHLVGRIEVQENEIKELYKHIVGYAKVLQQVREALGVGPGGDVVEGGKKLQDLGTSLRELTKSDEVVLTSGHTQHNLKVWPPYYQDILDYKKRFELRKKRDRNFQVGDTLRLAEFVPRKDFPDQVSQKGEFTGRECLVEVLYVLGGVFLPEGYACMSISKPVVLHL